MPAWAQGCASLSDRPWRDWAGWHARWIALPYPPVISVEAITYEDAQGVDQVLSASGWRSTAEGVEPAFGEIWPTGRVDANAVRIRYRAGYVADPKADPLMPRVPAAITAALLLMVGDLYANREAQQVDQSRGTAVENPTAAALLQPFRIYS